jgi:AmmeMemoRadiSam system protein B
VHGLLADAVASASADTTTRTGASGGPSRSNSSGLNARPRALIVPHGSWASAGPVMASAWAEVVPFASYVRRIVLLGASHHAPVTGLVAPFADAVATPLGVIPVDRLAIEAAGRFPQLSVNDLAHEEERSLEVHLPFVQAVTPGAAIVPLMVGEGIDQQSADVVDGLWSELTLVVVSTELSRYHDAKTARVIDESTAQEIESLDPTAIGEEQACGHAALRAILLASRARGLRARCLRLVQAGDPNEVIGFGSFAFAP